MNAVQVERLSLVPQLAEHPDFDAHEEVVLFNTGELQAIIALHNTARGPGMGGLRMWPYLNVAAALTDVLRLSRGMTYKSALARLPHGGGKGVIIGDPRNDKCETLWLAMGDFINSFQGRYIGGEDSGTSVADMAVIASRTEWVAGIDPTSPHGGDPSPSTAYGTFLGLKAAVRSRFGNGDLNGLRVAIQGVGNVGGHLARLLSEAGARLVISDINPANLARVQAFAEAEVVPVSKIHAADVEVFSPCAMGAVINDTSIDDLRAGVVAGAANNQLATCAHGYALYERSILYAPDYAVNPGGVIDIALRCRGEAARINAHIQTIEGTLDEIFARSAAERLPTHVVADRLAEERFKEPGVVV
ncbi:MAG: Glu/Leu/Phe/Val dehydrogenase dimerization domain-containing protein [Pseudomonadota bacterium]